MKYKRVLDTNLDQFVNDDLLSVCDCLDPQCSDNEHVLCLENLYSVIVKACLLSAQQSIPQSGNRPRDVKCVMPGFNEYVKEYRDIALSWHKLWKCQGKPRSGHVSEMRRVTRAQYHYRVKCVKQQQNAIRSEKMAQCIKSSNQRDLWNLVRYKKKSGGLPSTVDGCNDPDGISKIFASKYKTLYNSVGFNDGDLNNLCNRVSNAVDSGCLQNALFTLDHIQKALSFLKTNKHDGRVGLYSDGIIHGTVKLHKLLVKVFNCMLVHGCSPDDMLQGTLSPIVKDKRGKLNNSDNFRSICLQNVLCKLMDMVVLLKESACLCTSDMQFGFKPGLSTALASTVFLETTDYYVGNGGNVYALALDATKAFDRVNYIKLFTLLESRNLNPCYIRYLLNNYIHQKLRVTYNGASSDWFGVSNGVKQGAVLSPTLYSVYVDNLLCKIRDQGLGCHIGNVCCGVIGYADDLLLLAPTRESLQHMISICEAYASEYDIKFNGLKSQLMVFGKCSGNISVCVSGENVKVVRQMKYLGNMISNCTYDPLITNVRNDFICKVNSFLANFSHVSSQVKNSLFQNYCFSLYGSNLCMLDHSSISQLSIAWRKAVRRIWNIPYKTHSRLLPHISQCLPIDLILYKRFMKHFISGLNHKNESVRNVFASSLYHSSRLSNNFRFVAQMCKLGIPRAQELHVNTCVGAIVDRFYSTISESDIQTAQQIRELCIIRDKACVEEWLLSKEEINLILYHLSTS